jgi:hypothetical protein
MCILLQALKGRKKRDEEVATVGDYQSIEGYQVLCIE